MIYPAKVLTAPETRIVELDGEDGLKKHCNISHSQRDALITSYAIAAEDYVQWRTGRSFFETDYETAFDCFKDELALPYGTPIKEVEIKYFDSEGNDAVAVDEDLYFINNAGLIGTVVLHLNKLWPSVTLRPRAGVQVLYTGGDDDVDVPNGIKQAVRLLVGAMWEHREGEIMPDRSGIQMLSFEYGVEALLRQHQWSFPV